jgi:flavin-dependent dehydrogenase
MFLTDVDLIPTTRRSNLFSWWVEKLEATKHVSLRFRQTEDARQLHLRPARSQRLNQLCGKGWIAIGDAALAYDPLSSRGIAKALKHGRLAAAVIADCLIGNVDALETYRMKMFSEFSEYLALRQRYYSIENRWPNSAYWSRRRLKGGSHLKQS